MPWLVTVLLVSIFVSILRGGRFENLSEIHLRMWLLLPLGYLMQSATFFLPNATWAPRAGFLLILLSYVPLVAVVVVNRDKPGLWISGIGILMNFSVIAINRGMPVLTESIQAATQFTLETVTISNFKHVIFDQDTRLGFLADVIPMNILGMSTVISLGDVLLALGLGVFLEDQLRRPVSWFRHKGRPEGGSATR
jgi:hypothetical protein